MGPLRDSYSFADFANLWAAELERIPADIASILAAVLVDGQMDYDVRNPRDPGPSHNQQVPFEDDTQWQEFTAAVSDHLYGLAQGTDVPDFTVKLRYVTLDRDIVQSWLSSRGEQMPKFWRTDVPVGSAGENPADPDASRPSALEYRNLQKVVAVLTLLVAEKRKVFKHGDRINVEQIILSIRGFLDQDPEISEMLGGGLARSTLHAKITEALKVLDEDR